MDWKTSKLLKKFAVCIFFPLSIYHTLYFKIWLSELTEQAHWSRANPHTSALEIKKKTDNCFSLDRAHATFLEIWPVVVQKHLWYCWKNEQRSKPIGHNFPLPSLSKIMEIGLLKVILWYYITSVFHFTSIAIMICLCKSALKKKYNINVEDQEYFLQFSCQKHNSAKFCSLIYFFYWYKSFKSTLTFTIVFEI